MDWPLKVQGRVLHESEVEEIQTLLREQPLWGRTRLSVAVCRQWNWRRPDGQLKDIACREFLRKLERRGLLALPPRQRKGPQKSPVIADIKVDQRAITVPLSAVQPIALVDARRCSEDERRFNYLLKTHHYLGFSRPVGQNMLR